MAMRKGGISLVVGNYGQFISQIGRARTAVNQLGNTSSDVSKKLAALASAQEMAERRAIAAERTLQSARAGRRAANKQIIKSEVDLAQALEKVGIKGLRDEKTGQLIRNKFLGKNLTANIAEARKKIENELKKIAEARDILVGEKADAIGKGDIKGAAGLDKAIEKLNADEKEQIALSDRLTKTESTLYQSRQRFTQATRQVSRAIMQKRNAHQAEENAINKHKAAQEKMAVSNEQYRQRLAALRDSMSKTRQKIAELEKQMRDIGKGSSAAAGKRIADARKIEEQAYKLTSYFRKDKIFANLNFDAIISKAKQFKASLGGVADAPEMQQTMKKLEEIIALEEQMLEVRGRSAKETEEVKRIEKELSDQREILSQQTNEYKSVQNEMSQTTGGLTDRLGALAASHFRLNDIADTANFIAGKNIVSSAGLISVLGKLVPVLAALAVVWKVNETAIKIFKAVLDAVITAIKWAIDVVKKLISTLAKIGKSIFDFGKKIFDFVTKPIRNFFGRMLEIFGGIALYDIIRNISYGMKQLARDTFDAVMQFQLLEIRFRTIAARDIQKGSELMGKQIMNLQEAYAAAENSAKGLFDWVKLIAVQTPFTVESISSVVTMGTAMGMGVNQAKDLSLAIGNLTAAFGLEEETSWRIIYNFGQMIQRGRLTGEEFRDLSRNFVPIYEILGKMAKRVGMTTNEFRDLAFEGGVPVMDFIKEFVGYVNTNFPDAMRNLSGTWQVLTQNIKDFFQAYLGLDVLGPVLNKFAENVNKTFSAILESPAFKVGIKAIGQSFLFIFEKATPVLNKFMDSVFKLGKSLGLSSGTTKSWAQANREAIITLRNATERAKMAKEAGEQYAVTLKRVSRENELLEVGFREQSSAVKGAIKDMGISADKIPGIFEKIIRSAFFVALLVGRAIEAITNKFNEFSEKAGETMSGVAVQMKNWGRGIVQAFADGMIIGIKLLIIAIKTIASIIKAFFKTKSPPKVAPDIDDYGRSLIEEYGEGMTKFDFMYGIDKNVTKPISRALTVAAKKVKKVVNNLGQLMSGKFLETIRGFSLGDFEFFDNISGMVENWYRSLPQFQNKPGLIQLIIGSRDQIAKAVSAVSSGMKSVDDAVSEITQNVSGLTDDFTDFIRATFDAAYAEKKLNDAQKDLNLVTEKYEKILSDLNEQLSEATEEYDENIRLKEIEEAIASGLLTVAERDRLENEKKQILLRRQIRETEAQRDAEISLAEDRVEIAEADLAYIKEKLDLSQKIIEAQIKNNELLAEYANLIEAARSARGGGTGGDGGQEPPYTPSDLGLGGILDFNFEEILKDAERSVETFLSGIETALDPIRESMQEIFGTGEEGGVSLFGDLQLAIKDLATSMPDLGTIANTFNDFYLKVKDIQDLTLGSFLRTLVETVTGLDWITFESDMGALKTSVSGAADALLELFSQLLQFGISGFGLLDGLYNLLAGEKANAISKAADTLRIALDSLNLALRTVKNLLANFNLSYLNPVNLPFNIGKAILGAATDINQQRQAWLYEQNLLYASGEETYNKDYRQVGGPVYRGQPYIVGERRPEVFVPKQDGTIIPSIQKFSNMIAMQMFSHGDVSGARYNTNNVSRTTQIEVNASYSNHQSRARIYHDVEAALAYARI